MALKLEERAEIKAWTIHFISRLEANGLSTKEITDILGIKDRMLRNWSFSHGINKDEFAYNHNASYFARLFSKKGIETPNDLKIPSKSRFVKLGMLAWVSDEVNLLDKNTVNRGLLSLFIVQPSNLLQSSFQTLIEDKMLSSKLKDVLMSEKKQSLDNISKKAVHMSWKEIMEEVRSLAKKLS